VVLFDSEYTHNRMLNPTVKIKTYDRWTLKLEVGRIANLSQFMLLPLTEGGIQTVFASLADRWLSE
jgi:hypothetical protein